MQQDILGCLTALSTDEFEGKLRRKYTSGASIRLKILYIIKNAISPLPYPIWGNLETETQKFVKCVFCTYMLKIRNKYNQTAKEKSLLFYPHSFLI